MTSASARLHIAGIDATADDETERAVHIEHQH